MIKNVASFIKTIKMHELYGNQLKADTRVMFHVNHADKNGNGNTIVRGNDTDRAMIITCDANLLINSHLWYGFGVDHNISQEFLDATKLHKCYMEANFMKLNL